MRMRWITAAALVALMGAACGGGGGEQADASSKQEDAQEQALDYAECMREHGIDMPDPEIDDNGMMRVEIGGDPEDLRSEEMQEAQEACQELLPEMEEPSEEEQAEIQDQMLEFAECMREHGIDMPDPNENGAMVGGEEKGVESVVDFDDPDFQAAQEACKEYMPGEGAQR